MLAEDLVVNDAAFKMLTTVLWDPHRSVPAEVEGLRAFGGERDAVGSEGDCPRPFRSNDEGL